MGRKRQPGNLHLPVHMRAREKARGKVYYYYDHGGTPRRETPLGSDYPEAIRKWAELEGGQHKTGDVVTIAHAISRYQQDVIPTKAARTQKDNLAEIRWLLRFFGDPPVPLSKLEPIHVRQYMDWRVQARSKGKKRKDGSQARSKGGAVRANRERALLSHVWNKAREWGYTDRTNPCDGVAGFSETGRKKVYVEDDAYAAVWQHADQPTRDAMDLAYLIGQRPADTLKFDERDVRDGVLLIEQNKTGTKLRMKIEGELDVLLKRIADRKKSYKVRATRLIVNESGQPLTAGALRKRFDAARAAAGVAKAGFQFRDLRAKAGTDKADAVGDIRQVQQQLGHASVVMTEQYVRQRRGAIVSPTK
jgi:integrase